MKLALLAFVLLLFACPLTAQETSSQRTARMKWWREARFGLFIHWGVYAVPAGLYAGKTGHGEWIMETGQVPAETYASWRDRFNPVNFDAAQWARIAKDAGMKYVVITTKHHDGFALYDSQVSDWDIMSTPFKRDIMKELSSAVRKEGLVQCWYHSIMDWHHPDYFPHRAWAPTQPVDANFDRYEKYLHAQVSELLSNYGPIGVMWFDGEWERTWNHDRGSKLDELCRKLQPNVIVNNRVDVGRGGMAGMSDLGYRGDFGTPEQEIPAAGLPGVDWESCMTMNGHWGYNAADKSFKSTKTLVRMLCDIASKGGNFLLNVGPKADGTFPEESIERLQEMGRWMKVNGEAIHGTTASPLGSMAFGRCTAKIGRSSTKLYLHVFDWPADGKLVVPGIGNKIKRARVLGQGSVVRASQENGDLMIRANGVEIDPYATVVELELVGKPIVYVTPSFKASTQEFVRSVLVEIQAGEGVEIRYTTDGLAPNEKSSLYRSPFEIVATSTLRARAFHQGKGVSGIGEATFTKVEPWSATDLPPSAQPGLMRYMQGRAVSKIPDEMLSMAQGGQRVDSPTLGEYKSSEHLLLRFSGYLLVEEDEIVRISLTSDDGSKLWIDGKLVVDNDGLHGPEQKVGHAPLRKGWHRIELVWFNATGGAALDLRWGLGASPFVPIPLTNWRA